MELLPKSVSGWHGLLRYHVMKFDMYSCMGVPWANIGPGNCHRPKTRHDDCRVCHPTKLVRIRFLFFVLDTFFCNFFQFLSLGDSWGDVVHELFDFSPKIRRISCVPSSRIFCMWWDEKSLSWHVLHDFAGVYLIFFTKSYSPLWCLQRKSPWQNIGPTRKCTGHKHKMKLPLCIKIVHFL